MKTERSSRNLRELSTAKRGKRRQELINAVHSGFEIAGDALQELRDDEHWKDTHTSWIAFCKETFSISKTKLFNLLKYTEVVGSLSKENQPKITSTDQALALARIPEKERDGVIEKAENNGGLAADNLRLYGAKPASVKRIKNKPKSVPNSGPSSSESAESEPPPKPKSTPKEKSKVWLDENKYPIPLDALPWWEEAWGKEHEKSPRVQDVLTQISKLKSIVVGGREEGEFRWLKVTNSIADTFDSLRSLISEAKPYAVCTTCMGSPSLQPEGCNFCKNTGLISKWQWDTQSRKEVKEMMLRRAADLKKERDNVH